MAASAWACTSSPFEALCELLSEEEEEEEDSSPASSTSSWASASAKSVLTLYLF